MAKVKITLPDIDANTLSDKEMMRKILSYLYQLNEELRYQLTHIDDPVAGDVNNDLMNKAKEEIKRFLKRYGYSSLVKKVSKLKVSQISVSNDNEDIYYTFSEAFMIRVRVAPTLRIDYFCYNGQ